MRFLPAKYKNGITEYEAMIIGEGGSIRRNLNYSKGTLEFNRTLLRKNTCFNQLHEKFIADIMTKELGGKVPGEYMPLILSTDKHSVETGALWKIAMRYSGHNKNLAMMLIGICGHDDYFSKMDERCGQLKRTSFQYIPGTLGAETLLPGDFVNRIANIQAPTMGASALPAKYYHTIAAAYTSCALIRNGIPSFLAEKIQVTAANVYRIHQLCEKSIGGYDGVGTNAIDSDIFRKILDDSKINYENSLDYLTSLVMKCLANKNGPLCGDIDSFRKAELKGASDRNGVMGYFEKIITRHHTRLLANKEVLKGRSCTDLGSYGGVETMRIVGEDQTSDKCGDLSGKACELAKKKLLTYWMDLEWTARQHQRGAQFAAKNCEEETDFLNEGLEKKSCSALDDYNATSHEGVVTDQMPSDQ